MGPIIGLRRDRLDAADRRRQPRAGRSGVGRWLAPTAAFGALGLLSLQYPQLLGNGRGIVQLGIVGNISLGLLVMLLLLKPLVTAACIASGLTGRAVHADVRGRRAARGRRRRALDARVARLACRRPTR